MPAFSFSKQKKQCNHFHQNAASFVKFDKCIPTVGKYNVTQIKFNSRIKTAPSVSLTKATRYSSQKNVVPGPGAYQTDKMHENSQKGISMKGTHELRVKTQGPSPSQYNPKVEFATKKFSFPKSSQKKLSFSGPDPGTYKVNYQVMNSTSNYVFDKSQRQTWEKKNWMKNVGPGCHEIKEKLVIEQKNQYSFPKTQKFNDDNVQIKEKSIIPGPGKYDVRNARQTHNSVKFALAAKTIAIKQIVPGPGAYQLSDKEDSVKGVKIGKQNRDFNYTVLTPGPGAYEVDSMIKLKSKQAHFAVFPKSPRMRSSSHSLTVGPGNYNIASEMENITKRNKGFTIAGKTSKQKIQKSPGPQAYNPDFAKVYSSCERSVFDKSRKLSLYASKNPGPGAYQTKQKLFSKTFYFNKADSKSLDQKKSETKIGPGQYQLKPFFGQFDGKEKQSQKKQNFYV